VKPYVTRNNTDGRDAEAICEAMPRATMRFVAQQTVAALHRTRALLVRQRAMVANALRAACAEFGMVAAPGVRGVRELIVQVPASAAIPAAAGQALLLLARHGEALGADIRALENRIVRTVRTDEAARRPLAIPGIGPISASAIVAAVPDAWQLRSGRGLAAWLGLPPRQNNRGGKRRAGGMSKPGERHIRSLPIRAPAQLAV
jgi:transposase